MIHIRAVDDDDDDDDDGRRDDWMKTLVEIYDGSEGMYNVMASLVYRPERLILLGSRDEADRRDVKGLKKFFEEIGQVISLELFAVDMNSLEAIIGKLESFQEAYEDWAINIFGGNELILFAAGMFCMGKNIPVFSFFSGDGKFAQIYRFQEESLSLAGVHLKVGDFVTLSGGDFFGHGHMGENSLAEEEFWDIDCIWGVYKKYIGTNRWKHFVLYLQWITKEDEEEKEREEHGRLKFQGEVRIEEKKLELDWDIINDLSEIGALVHVEKMGNRIAFAFKNPWIKHCLKDAGVWLELFLYKMGCNMEFFDEVQNSVMIDWNGEPLKRFDTINEIDVTMVKGVIPLLISCKTSVVTVDALHEIHTIAERFGGPYKRPVIATTTQVKKKFPSIFQRAKELGIYVLEQEDFLGDGTVLEQKLRRLCEIGTNDRHK